MKSRRDSRSLNEIRLELVQLGATKSQLNSPEVKYLPRVLFENETIKAYIIGFYEGGYGMLVATNLRLLFVDVMVFGRVKVDDIAYGTVNGTELELGIFFGTVKLVTRAGKYRFWWLNKDNAYEFDQYVERQMLKHQKEDVKVD